MEVDVPAKGAGKDRAGSRVSQLWKDRSHHETLLGTEEKERGWQGEQGRR